MKLYLLHRSTSGSAAVHNALGLAKHIRQIDVFVAARSKAEAHRILAAHGFHTSIGSEDFRTAAGNVADAMVDAGLAEEHAVYAVDMTSRPGNPVVRVYEQGTDPKVIGHVQKKRADAYGVVIELVPLVTIEPERYSVSPLPLGHKLRSYCAMYLRRSGVRWVAEDETGVRFLNADGELVTKWTADPETYRHDWDTAVALATAAALEMVIPDGRTGLEVLAQEGTEAGA